jgi:hypothetical protein
LTSVHRLRQVILKHRLKSEQHIMMPLIKV